MREGGLHSRDLVMTENTRHVWLLLVFRLAWLVLCFWWWFYARFGSDFLKTLRKTRRLRRRIPRSFAYCPKERVFETGLGPPQEHFQYRTETQKPKESSLISRSKALLISKVFQNKHNKWTSAKSPKSSGNRLSIHRRKTVLSLRPRPGH